MLAEFMLCLVAIIAISFIGGRTCGFAYQVTLGGCGCALFTLAFLITYVVAG